MLSYAPLLRIQFDEPNRKNLYSKLKHKKSDLAAFAPYILAQEKKMERTNWYWAFRGRRMGFKILPVLQGNIEDFVYK